MQPSEPDPQEKPSKWPLWRRVMLAGALVLLFNALAEAVMNPDPPRAVGVAVTVLGFVLLAFGFGERMRNR